MKSFLPLLCDAPDASLTVHVSEEGHEECSQLAPGAPRWCGVSKIRHTISDAQGKVMKGEEEKIVRIERLACSRQT